VTDDEAPAGIQVPDDLPDDSVDAYLLGVSHTAGRFGATAEALEAGINEYFDEDEDDDVCPDCGGELVEDFGGARCTDCDYVEGD
jgi:hypothetical protein